jgi:Protein of unknown function (DUF2917)
MHWAWREAVGRWFQHTTDGEERGREAVVRYAHPLPMRADHRCVIRCIDGCAWVTVDGDIVDTVLVAGQTVVIPAKRSACITGMNYCVIEILDAR